MVAHVRRFANLHPTSLLVTAHIPEPTIICKKKNRHSNSGNSFRKSRPSTRIITVRNSHTNSTSKSFRRIMFDLGVDAELVEHPSGVDFDVNRNFCSD